jgi:hypothetical protein
MHELWLQKYIKEHYRQIGFTQIHGPYKIGADFKGIYAGRAVKIEAEWEYSDYINHKHSLSFADILVVATLETVPPILKEKLPPVIINLDREQVLEWAQPRMVQKNEDDFHSYTWRRFSRNLLYLYAYRQKQERRKTEYIGSNLVHSMRQFQIPAGFQFGSGGKEENFEGLQEDKASWDYWLNIAHAVAVQFKLKPTLLHPTWIERVAIYVNNTGRITDSESTRFKEVAMFIDELIIHTDSKTNGP